MFLNRCYSHHNDYFWEKYSKEHSRFNVTNAFLTKLALRSGFIGSTKIILTVQIRLRFNNCDDFAFRSGLRLLNYQGYGSVRVQ